MSQWPEASPSPFGGILGILERKWVPFLTLTTSAAPLRYKQEYISQDC